MIKHRKITIDNQKKIMLVLIFMSFAIGLWSNFRQLWLQDSGLSVSNVSTLISMGMFGSCFLTIIVSLFSTKVRIKEVLVLSTAISIISMVGLLFTYKTNNIALMKTFVMLTIITEYLFWIGIYPLFTTVKKTEELYEKKTIIQNFCIDISILIGGLLIGKRVGNTILNNNFCLLMSIIFSLIGLFFLLSIRYKKDQYNKIKTKEFSEALKIIIKQKIIVIYLLYSFLVNMAWDIIVGLQLILFTNGFNLPESITSTIILVLGLIATLVATLFVKKLKFKSNFIAALIKYLPRIILYFLVFVTKNVVIAIIAFGITIITSRMCSNNTDGAYINILDNNLQFIFSSINMFMITLGETIGIFLAGFLFEYGIHIMFFASMVIYIIILIISYILSKLYKNY